MKAATRKKRREARRGRAIEAAAPKAEEPSENMTLSVIEARRRVYQLPAYLASHEKAGTALGRLWLRKEITETQREAGEQYLALYEAYQRALKAPVGLRVTNAVGDGGDDVSEEYVIWATKAVSNFEVMQTAVEDIRPKCEATIRYVVLLDNDPRDFMLTGLCAGLEVLAVKLGIVGDV